LRILGAGVDGFQNCELRYKQAASVARWRRRGRLLLHLETNAEKYKIVRWLSDREEVISPEFIDHSMPVTRRNTYSNAF